MSNDLDRSQLLKHMFYDTLPAGTIKRRSNSRQE